MIAHVRFRRPRLAGREPAPDLLVEPTAEQVADWLRVALAEGFALEIESWDQRHAPECCCSLCATPLATTTARRPDRRSKQMEQTRRARMSGEI